MEGITSAGADWVARPCSDTYSEYDGFWDYSPYMASPDSHDSLYVYYFADGENEVALPGSPKLRVAVADAAKGEVQGVLVARQSAGFGDVDNLPLEQIGQVLVEALAA